MGLDYSYEVYIHRDRAAALLSSIADNMAEESRHGEWTIAEIAGDRVLLPCSAGFKSGRTVGLDPSNAKTEFLDLVLRFDADDSLRAYNDPEDDGRHRVGLIYLSVWNAPWISPDHLEFDFMAATTRMSKLFLDSPAIRNWFASLTIDNAGPLCLLDVEQGLPADYGVGHFIVISSGTRKMLTRASGTRQEIFARIAARQSHLYPDRKD